jgi:hypothetical protein
MRVDDRNATQTDQQRHCPGIISVQRFMNELMGYDQLLVKTQKTFIEQYFPAAESRTPKFCVLNPITIAVRSNERKPTA